MNIYMCVCPQNCVPTTPSNLWCKPDAKQFYNCPMRFETFFALMREKKNRKGDFSELHQVNFSHNEKLYLLQRFINTCLKECGSDTEYREIPIKNDDWFLTFKFTFAEDCCEDVILWNILKTVSDNETPTCVVCLESEDLEDNFYECECIFKVCSNCKVLLNACVYCRNEVKEPLPEPKVQAVISYMNTKYQYFYTHTLDYEININGIYVNVDFVNYITLNLIVLNDTQMRELALIRLETTLHKLPYEIVKNHFRLPVSEEIHAKVASCGVESISIIKDWITEPSNLIESLVNNNQIQLVLDLHPEGLQKIYVNNQIIWLSRIS